MRVIFIEYYWQVEEILKNKEKFINDVIISLHLETSYLLMRNNIRYFETFEFCKHDELWKKYKDITKNSLNIAKVLDDTLWEIDERFRKYADCIQKTTPHYDKFDLLHYAISQSG